MKVVNAMKDKKKVIKFFLLPDYEKEEKYLSQMHKKGWKIKKILPYYYIFEKCKPEDVVYKLDFIEEKDFVSYIQLFKDYGWEYIQDLNQFSYFRKNTSVTEEDNEIFSDNKSKINMMKKIISRRLIPLFVLYLLIVIPNLLELHTVSDSIVLKILWITLFIIYTSMLTHCVIGFIKLNKKYKEL